jgi:hypothetical protein
MECTFYTAQLTGRPEPEGATVSRDSKGRVPQGLELGWPDVISLIHPGNQRSIGLASRLGERFERTIELRGLPHSLYRLVQGA